MRLFAIGDIHGCADALDELVNVIDLRPGDRIITLGDYVNKGEDSKRVLGTLIQLYQKGYLIPLKGNHELKLLQAIALGQQRKVDKTLIDEATLRSYAPFYRAGKLTDIPETHLHFIRHCCLNWYETDTHIFVHATVDPGLLLHEQPQAALFWNKLTNPRPHISGKTLVCGHTPQRTGSPLNFGHAICIDTAAAEGQWLTCLNVTSGEIWQANQTRELQQSWLSLHQSRQLTYAV